MKKFSLGELVTTSGVAEKAIKDKNFKKFLSKSLERYKAQDLGDMDKHDKALNDRAVKHEERVLAHYRNKGKKNESVYIVTEWDRSATTIMFPHEY